eukprot:bmy_20587T0
MTFICRERRALKAQGSHPFSPGALRQSPWPITDHVVSQQPIGKARDSSQKDSSQGIIFLEMLEKDSWVLEDNY